MNVYEIITERITKQLDQGVVPWRKTWDPRRGQPRNLVRRTPYRGVNVFVLQSLGFSSAYFLTARQIAELGGHIRAGSRGAPIIYWKWTERKEEESEGIDRETPHRAPLLRYYTVFNLEQTQGIAAPAEDSRPTFAPIAACEAVVARMEKAPAIHHGGDAAYYQPSLDAVHM